MSFKITQEDYDVIVFLTKLVYFDLKFPEPFVQKERIESITGLRIDMFDMGEYDLFVMCGTNGLNDWITNLKVMLGFTPRQYDQAYYNVKNRMPNSSRPVVIAGHSLGGGLAEYVASNLYYHSQVICLTFNGCGVAHLIHPILRKENDMFNIITDDDILNNITKPLAFLGYYMQHTGKVIIIKDNHFFLSVKSHVNFAAFNKVTIDDLYGEVKKNE